MASQEKQVADIMSDKVQFIHAGSSMADAARTMRDIDCGFLPISDEKGEKLLGVVTDRDIVVRAIAKGKDPSSTLVEDICGDNVLYCFAHDALSKAAKSMREQQVYRLVVLDNAESKKLCGVISLNDIVRHNEHSLAMDTVQAIAA